MCVWTVVEGDVGSLARRFAERVAGDPDFELTSAIEGGRIRFRAVPYGLDEPALDGFNAELRERVNQTGEVELSALRVRGRVELLLSVAEGLRTEPDVERAWEVIGDAFRGILVDSPDAALRWEFPRVG